MYMYTISETVLSTIQEHVQADVSLDSTFNQSINKSMASKILRTWSAWIPKSMFFNMIYASVYRQ